MDTEEKPLAETEKADCKKKQGYDKGDPSQWQEEFCRCLYHWFDVEQNALSELTTTLKIASSGNETDSKEQYKLDTELRLTKGIYPHQMAFHGGSSFRLEDGKLEEEVANLTLQYDRYLIPQIEGWVFALRSSDSFMQIEQRYEVGLGADFEYRMGGSIRYRHRCLNDQENAVALRRGTDPGWETSPFQRLQAFEALARVDGDFKDQYCESLPGFLKRHGMLTLSLGFSAFAEFEQAEAFEVQYAILDEDGARIGPLRSREISIPSEQRFRWAVRPAFGFQPTERVSIAGRYYWKLPLDSPKSIEGERDVREVGELFVKYSVKEPDKAAMVFEFLYLHDSVPPRLAPDSIEALRNEAPGIDLMSPVVAEDSHLVFKLGLEVSIN